MKATLAFAVIPSEARNLALPEESRDAHTQSEIPRFARNDTVPGA
jgi:hypothetical protein